MERVRSIEEFLAADHEPHIQEIFEHLHQLLSEEIGLEPKLRFNCPFYFNRSWICYLNLSKAGGAELAFTRGNELSNEQGVLDFKGRKQVAGMDFHSVQEVISSREKILEIVHEALILDREVAYTVRKK